MIARRLAGLLMLWVLVAQQTGAQLPEIVIPTSNSNQMQAVAISRDEKFYASSDLDGKVKIWEAATGKLMKTLLRKNVTELAFHPDNQTLIICSYTPTECYHLPSDRSVFLGDSLYIGGLDISPDGKWIATANDKKAWLWNAQTLKLVDTISSKGNEEVRFSSDSKLIGLHGWTRKILVWAPEKRTVTELPGHNSRVCNLEFDSRNNRLLSSSWDSTARLWDLASGKEIRVFRGHKATVWEARFHPDGKRIITCSSDNRVCTWDLNTGVLFSTPMNGSNWIYRVRIAPDGKTYACSDRGGYCTVWDAATDTLLFRFRSGKETLYHLHYLKNSSQLLTGNYDPVLSRWNLKTRKRELVFGVKNERMTAIRLSHDEKKILTTSRDGNLRMIDAMTGKVQFNHPAFNGQWATGAEFSPDDALIVVAGGYKASVLLNANGERVGLVDDQTNNYESTTEFSPDGKYLLHCDDRTVQLIRAEDNLVLLEVDSISMFTMQRFSPDGNYLVTGGKKNVSVWEVKSGKQVSRVSVPTDFPGKIGISPDSKYFFSTDTKDGLLEVWELPTGRQVKKITNISSVAFTATPGQLLLVYTDGKVEQSPINGDKGKLITSLKQFNGMIDFRISQDEQLLITSGSQKIEAWDLRTGDKLASLQGVSYDFGRSGHRFYLLRDDALEIYTMPSFKRILRHYVTEGNNYLLLDSLGRYDGTDSARRLLYFTCGTEVIELDQAKDQLWVPGLAERMAKGETIHAKTLAALNICGLSPEIQESATATGDYLFRIRPRRGGLGETVLYVNGIEALRYKPGQLLKKGDWYELSVKRSSLLSFFIAGQDNKVTAKAYTSDNSVLSRGAVVTANEETKPKVLPNLYAVMIGVSDYKGTELDLKYAAKDAGDISKAIAAASRKLLNTDGKEHVFIYNLTTSGDRYQLPEKNAVKKLLGEIAQKATASDVLLVFFAGHGVMAGEAGGKQFYFLTADASTLASTDAVKEVGISTAELSEWMKPQLIKAQKRILIFDACNSGQAIKDFVKMGGKDQQYLAARNDDKSQLVKAIDKLNEKSGLFILSASASDQSAYEMGRYSQGLLTYSLLKAIKEQPDILEDGKYLNVSRWFSAAERTVTDLSRENGARQEPQIVSTTNFNIGLVDAEVMAKIVLPQQKPLFAASNFQNSDEQIADDDLEFSKLINLQLGDMAARGSDSRIVYVTATNSPDAYTLTGRYTVSGNEVTVVVNLKQNKLVKSKFELSGTKDKLNELAAALAAKAADTVK